MHLWKDTSNEQNIAEALNKFLLIGSNARRLDF